MPQEGTDGTYLPPIRIVNKGDLRSSDEPGAEFRFGKDKRYKPLEGSIELETQYHRDYIQKPLAPTKMIRPDRQRENPGTFYGQPSYRDDYKAYEMPIDVRNSRHFEYRPPSKKFDGTSNYSLEYIQHQVTPFKSAKPEEHPTSTKDPFPKATSYRDSFPRYSNVIATQQMKRPRWQPLLAPMSDITNYKSDYTQKDLHVRTSCKPDVIPLKADTAFEDSTTQKSSYIDWKVARPYAQERPIFKVPDGEFDFTTTTSQEYTSKPMEKVTPRRPVELTKSLPTFDGTTNYELEFPNRPLGERTKPLKRPTQYFIPQATFGGEPTYSADYIPHNVTPRIDHRPNPSTLRTMEPFPTHTESRDNYIHYDLPGRENLERPVWQPSGVKLEATTTYQSEFVERQLAKSENFKPNQVPLHFEDTSEYRTTHLDSFTPWKFVNRGSEVGANHQIEPLVGQPNIDVENSGE